MYRWLTVGVVLGSAAVAWPARAAEDDLGLDLGGSQLDLRRIPKGTFVQGSPAGEPGHEAEEAPRSVTITHAFWIGKVPVTRGQFARFAGDAHYVTEAEKGTSGGFGWDGKAGTLVQRKEFSWKNPGFAQKDDEPVVLVTFGDATAFTAWASRKVGRRVRLPTEAEWEYAARAGSGTPWYAASREEEALALGWFKPNAASSTHPVGLKKPNAFGLFDMAGNVNEWCRDVYAPYPPGEGVDPENAVAAPGGEPERRVLRGGSWLRDPKKGRSAARYRNAPGARNADNGFRIVVEDDATAMPGAPSAAPLGSATNLGADASTSAVVPTPSPARAEGASWALVAAPAAAAGAVVAWVLARRRRTAPDGRGIGTRAQDDGFWVRAEGLPPGSRIRYACVVGGVEVSDVVPLDGGEETFVYTGARPSAIRITEVVPATPLAAAQGGYRMASPATPSSAALPAAPPVPPPLPRASTPSIPRAPAVPPAPSSPRVPAADPVPPVVVAEQILNEDSSFRGYPSAY